MMGFFLAVLAAFLFISPSWSAAASDQDNPIEIGHVSWSRDYQGALQASRHSGKPVFLFFQEVPGCLGCRTFGSQVLTHPLLVEAVEDEFIPVLVYNNRRTGMDAQLLKQYGEPSWNYQVIRFVDANERDLIPRRDRVWDIGSLAARMVAALKAADRSVPLYLSSLAVEYDTSHLQTAVFGMYCFWTGEYELGSIAGVVATEAGFYRGREVTLVTYHNDQLALKVLIGEAEDRQCARTVYLNDHSTAVQSRLKIKQFEPNEYQPAPASDQKKQLQQWLMDHRNLSLTMMQLTKLNSFLAGDPEAMLQWLSPRQLAQLGSR
ncbi:MAG: thioredoxin family protein [Desulfofustis sp.]|nr:thioredoxin family protein [Desulfofustis sp.]NNK58402.1 hypothetical protein [Desulfofustis sp.]